MSLGHPRRFGARGQKLRAPRSHGLSVSVGDMWARLADAIAQIQRHNISRLSYEEHYRYAYNLVLNQQGDMLYAGVARLVEAHVAHLVAQHLVPAFPLDAAATDAARAAFAGPGTMSAALGLVPRSDAAQPVLAGIPARERFLSAVTAVWDDHCSCMGKIRDVLKYVDRVYVVNHGKALIWDLGLALFRDTAILARGVPLRVNLYAALLAQLHCEREGVSVERSKIRAACDMLQALEMPAAAARAGGESTSVYRADFEPLVLALAAEYYAAEAALLLQHGDAAHYLAEVERRLADEEARIAACMAADSAPAVRAVLERELIYAHLDAVLAMKTSGLVPLLEADRRDDLARLHRLFGRVDGGLPALHRALRVYATEHGRMLNEQSAPEGQPGAEVALHWVDSVLAFKARFDGVLCTAFAGDMGAEAAVNEAFYSFINMHARAPEYISLFIDEHLKKGARSYSDEETDSVLDRATVIFRYLNEKDVFERYYKLHLTRRLLQGRSVSDDAERGMVAKLKNESGHGYVQKLQGMLNDMKLSTDVLGAFRNAQQRGTADATPFELNVNVLTATYWPISAPQQPAIFPPVMRQACAAFERYYDTRHRGRVLTWQPSLGSAEVRVRFRTRTHELLVSTYALIVLLQFEGLADGASLGYTDLLTSTALPPADLQRTLQSLACAKYRVLRKEPRGREVGANDRFFFNEDFACPLARVKIAQIAAKVETPAEHRETTAKVEEERKSLVEACIVRVMKSRRTLPHNDLVHEVVQQLHPRFQPSPALIKKRIESLLDREYLEARAYANAASRSAQCVSLRSIAVLYARSVHKFARCMHAYADAQPVCASRTHAVRAATRIPAGAPLVPRVVEQRLHAHQIFHTPLAHLSHWSTTMSDSRAEAPAASVPRPAPAAHVHDSDEVFARARALGLRLSRADYERTRAGITAFLRAERQGSPDDAGSARRRGVSFFSANVPDTRPRNSLDEVGSAEERRCRRLRRRRALEKQLAEPQASPAGSVASAPVNSPPMSPQPLPLRCSTPPPRCPAAFSPQLDELSRRARVSPAGKLWLAPGEAVDADDSGVFFDDDIDATDAPGACVDRMCLLDRIMARHTSPRRMRREAKARERESACSRDADAFILDSPLRTTPKRGDRAPDVRTPASFAPPSHPRSHARQRSLSMRTQLTPRADATPGSLAISPLRHTETPMVTPMRFPGMRHRRNSSATSVLSPNTLTPWIHSARQPGSHMTPATLASSPYTGDAAVALSLGGGPAKYGLMYTSTPNAQTIESEHSEPWPDPPLGGSPARILCIDSFPGKSPIAGDASPVPRHTAACSPLAAKGTRDSSPVHTVPSIFLSFEPRGPLGSPEKSRPMHRRVPSRRLDTISPADILYFSAPPDESDADKSDAPAEPHAEPQEPPPPQPPPTPPPRHSRRKGAVSRLSAAASSAPTHKTDVFAPAAAQPAQLGASIDSNQLDDPMRTVWQQPDGSCIVKLVSEELQAAINSGSLDHEPDPRYYRLPPGYGSSKAKPSSVSYAGLIGQAILSSSDGRLSLAEIYTWISTVYPFYERGDRGWQNSIRHNLSLNKSFVKLERESSIPGKGGWWAIAPGHEVRFCNGIYLANASRDTSAAGTGERTFRVTHAAPQAPPMDERGSIRKRRSQVPAATPDTSAFKRPRAHMLGETPANVHAHVPNGATPMRSARMPSSVYNSRHMPLLTDASSPPTSPLADFVPLGANPAAQVRDTTSTQYPRTLGQIVDFNMQLVSGGSAPQSAPLLPQQLSTPADKPIANASPTRMLSYPTMAQHPLVPQGCMSSLFLGGSPEVSGMSPCTVPWFGDSLTQCAAGDKPQARTSAPAYGTGVLHGELGLLPDHSNTL